MHADPRRAPPAEQSCIIEWKGSGCFRKPGTVIAGQALLIETMSFWVLLVPAFRVALDPRQGKLRGPLFGPLAFGLVPDYIGASANPAKHDVTSSPSKGVSLLHVSEYRSVDLVARTILWILAIGNWPHHRSPLS